MYSHHGTFFPFIRNPQKAKDESHFSQFVDGEPFQEYIVRKRQGGVHGNNPEIQAISELYNRPVEVFVPENGAEPLNIFQSDYKTGDAPIRLSYHDGNHYNAVIDPLLPTAGLGLGLPGLEPGLADKLQLKKAVDESDQFFMQQIADEAHEMEVKRAMEESKMSSIDYMHKKKAAFAYSDLEETDFEMEQAVLLSSLETYQRSEGSRKQSWDHGGGGRGRYGRGPSPPHCDNMGSFARSYSSTSPPAGVASLSAASMSMSTSAAIGNSRETEIPTHLLDREDSMYPPQTVQELVMNGFELQKVLKAYDLIGDNFDDLLAFLMSSGS